MVKTPDWPADRFKALIDRTLDETGLNKAQLAALLGINPSQVSRWINGSTRPRFDNLVALGNALNARFPNLDVTVADVLAAAGYSIGGPATESAPAVAHEFPKPDFSALPPNLADIQDPSPAEAAMIAAIAAMRQEMANERQEMANEIRSLNEEVAELKREQERRDRKGA
ncbi:helix-turn-helix domain-containing protein (plasmid) [Nonomuraea sp. CA-143628]|uniref:helix-turn-helix domain-containing protein n=1 Tax=Nonomuraea sp. CA-143628 TaxID=3239997 RepID=UPI003D8BA983